MLKLTTTLLTLSVSLIFMSCYKDLKDQLPTALATSIQGNYKFVSMTANTTVTQQVTSGADVAKTVTVANYTTTNNEGTLRIGANNMTSTNLSYAINTIAKGYIYANNTLLDSVDVPFQYSVPPTSTTSSIKMVGNDSVYFTSSSMFMNGTTQSTTPGGAKLKLEGDKLFMTTTVNQTTTQNIQGSTVLSTSKGTAVITLQKQ